MDQRYLTKENLVGFDKYKYNSVDTCVLSVYVLHPIWNWCVQFFPRWIAPNILTFTGFLLTVFTCCLFSWYDYGFFGNNSTDSPDDYIPRWAWALSAFSLLLAYALDCIDGKQARRTGTSGPLGELFDHGLDSYSAVLIPTCLYSIFGRHAITPLRMFFTVWNILINFYLPHWEKYNTGVMFLPWGYDFTMMGVVIVMSITSMHGPKVWDVQLPGGLTPGLVFEFTLYFSAMLTSQTTILWNIYKSYRDKTGKMRSFAEAMRPLVPIVIFFIISTIWAVFSPNNIIDKDPRIFYILTGTIFSNISCRLIVAQMSDVRCDIFNSLFYPYIIVIAIALYFPLFAFLELFLLYFLFVISTVIHIQYGAGVVLEMCEHFNIQCFHIKSVSKKH